MQVLQVADAPPLPSLRFRMFEPSDDYPAMVELLNAVEVRQPGTIALLDREGYAPVRSSYRMVRRDLHSLPQIAPLPNIRIEPLDPAKKRQIWEAVEEAFRDAWGFIPSNEAAYEAWARNLFLRPALSRIAWAGNEVAGTVLIFIDDADNQKRNRLRAHTETVT